MVVRGKRGSLGWTCMDVWDGHAIFKTDNTKQPLSSTGNSAQCGSLDGRGIWGEWIHVYVWLSPFTVHPKLSQDY